MKNSAVATTTTFFRCIRFRFVSCGIFVWFGLGGSVLFGLVKKLDLVWLALVWVFYKLFFSFRFVSFFFWLGGLCVVSLRFRFRFGFLFFVFKAPLAAAGCLLGDEDMATGRCDFSPTVARDQN